MSKKKKSVSAFSFISYILVLLFFFGCMGFLSVFTDEVKTDNTTSYIQYNGQRLTKEDSALTFEFNKDLKFNMVSFAKDKEYTVEIVPCNSFGYTVNGTQVFYDKTIKNIPTELYNVTKNSSGFVLRLFDFNILTILYDYHAVYSGIVLPDGYDLFGSYYALLITIDGEEDEYKIPFDLISPVEGVELGGNIVL